MRHDHYFPKKRKPFKAYGTDVRLTQRLRNFKELGIQDTQLAPELYDDPPGTPSKSMEVDRFKQPFVDPFALAEELHVDLADKALSRDNPNPPSETEGAPGTSPKEINDPD